MIKVSIIIPVFNGENYVEKCLNSIKKQTFKDFEVIIINDGSIDNTKTIINKYLSDKRFKLFDRTNHGIGASRNYGLDKSQGEYVCFIDSDDYIDDEYLERLYKKITKDNLDIVVCNYNEVNIESNTIKRINLENFNNTTIEKNPELLLFINKSPWNKIYRKTIIKDIKFPTSLKYEDTEFLCKVMYKAKIGYLANHLNYYVIHRNSETTTMDKRVFDIFKIIENIRNYYKDAGMSTKEYLNQMTLQILTTYTIQQRYQKDKKIRNKFIEDAFILMKKYDEKYFRNPYFKKRPLLKRIIEKNKSLTKIYCELYNLIH